MTATRERYRVDDLAGRAEISVDTIRFYQKRGLLPPPERDGRIAWYDEAHLERLARIRELQDQGLSLALIDKVLTLDATDAPLAAAVLEATAATESGAPLLTRAELATEAKVPAALVDAIVNEGLVSPRIVDGGERFSTDDVALLRAGLRLLEFGIPVPDLLALARDQHAMTTEIAERAVALFDASVRQPLRQSDKTDAEKAAALVAAFDVLLPAVSDLVARHFRHVLLDVAQAHLEITLEPGTDV